MEDHQISGNGISNKNLNPRQFQLFVKLLNGGTLSLQFPTPQIQVGDVKHRIHEITKIPINFQRLIRGHQLNDDLVISTPSTSPYGLLVAKEVSDRCYLAQPRREESARCVAVVEESVRAACQNGKRKAVPEGADPKKLKMCKGTEGSSGLVSGGNQDIEFSGGASSETGSEEEKEVVLQQSSESCGEDANVMVEADVIAGSEAVQADEIVPVAENGGVGSELNNEVKFSSKPESEVQKETVVSNANITEPKKPLNFNDFNSSEEMEDDTSLTLLSFLNVLGLERLKSELQACGLKCGGTVQEQAARLFLLKLTPFNKLPKKLLAKK
ncbi:hypothetical protein F3Y22_tig00111100pilonHSYRG00087 [Hibiscus syriacus]|uniref:Ubiquitin-like domain-containing protein n=1 Tax=Hibiscus syriacus TaxID=106335 RepID=A0A6A2YZZ0_HIBSY|nr:hypothetical protein F3Y22_tig00111100pilonHSYRG00087 [Hibiscus syriacus]